MIGKSVIIRQKSRFQFDNLFVITGVDKKIIEVTYRNRVKWIYLDDVESIEEYINKKSKTQW